MQELLEVLSLILWWKPVTMCLCVLKLHSPAVVEAKIRTMLGTLLMAKLRGEIAMQIEEMDDQRRRHFCIEVERHRKTKVIIIFSIVEGGGPKAQVPVCSQQALENPLMVILKPPQHQDRIDLRRLFYVNVALFYINEEINLNTLNSMFLIAKIRIAKNPKLCKNYGSEIQNMPEIPKSSEIQYFRSRFTRLRTRLCKY
uniref:Uncharacterized protein n=1 Tax=Romanomermis culicivorax TaxID=13658 RepID=A0A915HV50_ROMCU